MQDAEWSMTKAEHPIILFDNMCVLCSINAQFILKYDKKHHFKLASMQGDVGANLYRKFGMDPNDPDTLIIVDGDEVIKNSDAVLSIYSSIGWPWKIMAIFKIIPRFLRDPIYLFIARNRYNIFGKRETCWMPSAADKKRVL